MEPNNKKQSLTTSASIHSLTNLSNSSANEKEKREESLTLKKENEEESLQSSSSTVETSGQIKERLRNTNNENSSIISQKNLINEESNNNNNKTKEKGTEFNKINLKKAATEKFVVGGEAFGTVIIEKAKIHPFKLLNFCLKIMIPKHKLDSSSADDKDIKKKKEEHRIVKANDREFNAKFKYADNFIKTSKYSLFTFVPVNLFQQFTRIANFYFLVLLCLQCIPQISSVNWVYTLVPLSFVLLCSAIKDGYDDLLRHRSDRIVNQRVAYVLRYNTKRGKIDICEEEWMNVKVGDIVRMESGDFIAADLLLLSTSDSGICYIETAELDGETNLKTKMALPCTAEMGDIIDKINAFDGLIVCEPPNNRLDQFNGRLEWEGKKYNLDNNNMLLRGCCLRNTRFCYGVVVFAGADTKLMQNSGEAPLKRTSLDKFLNLLILGIVLFLFVCTLICTLMTGFWEHIIGRHFRVFLPWDNIVPRIKNLTTISIPVVQGVSSILQTTDSRESSIAPSQVFFIVALQFFSYIILLNTVVPISLYISVEMIRLAHSKFINCDLKMYDPKTDTAANARTSTLNEELGQVQYIFSDKTGTLTQNVMIFKKCSINGRCYGDFRNERGDVIENIDENTQQGIDFSFNRWHEKNFKFYDKTLLIDTVEGLKEVQEFWRLLAICHTVMPEGKGDVLEYQAQSPDEAALTSAARNFGFVFRKRTPQSITLEVNGRTETYEVLHILDFDNVRKRMSLLVRTLNNQIRLYCKGADTMIMERLDEKNTSQLLREATLQHLDKFATDGLRTLCVAYKIVDGEYCEKWLAQLHEALLDLENKEKRVDVLYEEMEKDMLLLGATAIEDKLQDGVPQTIKALAAANIKLWVLTGDKTETAINIAFSCGLLTEYMREVSIIDGKDEKEVEVQLKDTIRRMQNAKVPQTVVGISSFYLPPRTPIRELSPSPTELPQNLNERQTKSASSQRPHSPIINSPTTVGQQSHRTSDVSTIFPVTLGHEEGLIINGKNNHIKLPLSEKRSEPYINKSFINQTIDDNDKNDDLIKEGSGGYALVINGEALVYALKKQHEKIFLEIARNCTSVICCRVTPLQKAKVVELVKRNIKAVTLSIGDGANDVSMIRTAHIGVGISGHEGMQAVLASDFSIGQFRYLERLLLVHGRWSYLRMCKFLRYFFYKNFAYTLTNFWYSFFSGYSAQVKNFQIKKNFFYFFVPLPLYVMERGKVIKTVYDPVLISLYNLLFTALPVLAMGILDQDVNEDYSLRFPRLYIPGQFNLFFNMRIFIYSIIHGMISSLVLFFVPYGTLYNSITSTGRDMNDYSILAFTSFTALVLVVNGQIAFDTSYWTWINWFVVFGSVGVYFAVVVGIYQVLPTRWLYGYVSIFNVDVFLRAITFPGFWLSLALICAILLLPVLGNRFFWFDAHPSYADRLRVRSRLYGEEKAKKQFPPQTSHNIPPRGRTSRWSSKQRDLRSGYAFSHCAGFGELIAKGTLFKNLEHLRIPAFQNKQQIHPTDTISTNNNNTSRTNENNTTNTRRSTFFNGGNVAGHHLLDSLRSLKKHKKSDNGNNDTNNISSLPISEENINNNSISITKFSPNIPSNISTTTTLLAEKENNNNNFENNINSNSSSSFSSSIPLTITKAEENIIGPMITHIPVNSSNINLNKNQQIDNNQQILKINNNNSSVIIPLRVPSPDRVNTTHSLVINADMEDEKPLPSNWCYNPDGTLYIPENQITENEQFPPSKQSTEIPIQINNTGKNNNNKFVSKKCKKTTNFVDSDGNSKSSSEANRKSIPIEIEKQRQQQQRLFTGKYRNTQQQHKENDDKTWKNERWKL